MEHEVGFVQKKQVYSELELARRDKDGNQHSQKFQADLDNYNVILPLKPEIENFEWIVSSISHEYLHLIIKELESYDASVKLDNLGYNLTTGCTSKRR